MSDCECIGMCRFFEDNAGRFGPVEPILKLNLCHNEGTECARHVVFAIAGKGAVPADLYPNDLQGAARILDRVRQ
ncbi:MAG: iron-containing alcohol dehydrogenase [Actinobacteria bacterium]|nr:MAG: iron-containing alcohol dehydrogenase [Actinomycetota bacterium]